MGSAARKCMTPGEGHPQLAHAKRCNGGGPGPGAYATGEERRAGGCSERVPGFVKCALNPPVD